ncbi:MAG: TIGR04282 family arsenosugar biosynthesis glycosyltransferase [Alphaproteobacteria bacterium]
MAKAPLAGQVKTRLLPALSPEQAARLAKALLVDQLNHVRKMESADLFLAFAPAKARPLMARLAPPFFSLFPQQGANLGARMQAVFEKLFRAGYKRVVLIGSDLAAVPLSFFAQAYHFLESRERRVALGPSRDGGYYLVGCNRPTPGLFSKMRWGHDAVLKQTLDRLARLKIGHDLLPVWYDVDTPEDVRALRAELDLASLANAMPETLNFLRDPQNAL